MFAVIIYRTQDNKLILRILRDKQSVSVSLFRQLLPASSSLLPHCDPFCPTHLFPNHLFLHFSRANCACVTHFLHGLTTCSGFTAQDYDSSLSGNQSDELNWTNVSIVKWHRRRRLPWHCACGAMWPRLPEKRGQSEWSRVLSGCERWQSSLNTYLGTDFNF